MTFFKKVSTFLKENRILSVTSFFVFLIFFLYWLFPEVSLSFFSWIKSSFVFKFFWIYNFVIFLCLALCFFLIVSPYRNIKVGKKEDEPEYNFLTWFTMLFSAGMGTGIMFCGIYEPLNHYFRPPQGVPSSFEPLDFSFFLTFWHWGFAGWALYVVVGFSLSYFCFRKGLPLRFSSALEPIFGEKIKGGLGHFIDSLVVLATLFGVSASLGRGSLQINAGLKELYGLPYSAWIQSGLILGITALATISVLSGIKRGIRRLSEINIFLCILLLIFLFSVGPTLFLTTSFFKVTGIYFVELFNLKTWMSGFGDSKWQSEWTTLYWAWWMAWTPFVGMFIARISKGRTVKEFILGSLLVPSLFSFLWFVVYGGTAIYEHLEGHMNLTHFLEKDYSLIIFKFLPHFPLSPFMSYLALIAILIFFVTSSDSASYMINETTTLKRSRPSYELYKKIYWAFMEGVVALVFLLLGGIRALEQVVIVISSPFCILILLLMFSLMKQLKRDFPSNP